MAAPIELATVDINHRSKRPMTAGVEPRDERTSQSPVVSVILLTYNHERYIEQALLSVLDQERAPKMEVLVADDCSTDRTPAILAELERKHPGTFRRLPRPHNLGLSRNLESAWQECRGRYIAILEGDDFWHDPHKLSRVIEALEKNPEWSGCFHAVQVEREGELRPGELLTAAPPGPVVSLEELLPANCVTTYSAMVYRRGLVDNFPSWHRYLLNGDFALHVLHCDRGPLGYLPDPMTTYRVHANGLWSSLEPGKRWQQYLALSAYLELHFEGRHAAALAQARQVFYDEFAQLKKIEQRYLALGLDKIAALLRRFLGR